jgi:membrane-associated protein
MFDVNSLIQSGGLLIICAIVFAETGLLVGFFLPGDTLLLSAGIFASQGKLHLIPTIIAVIVASILGNIAGYHIGKHSGKRLFKKQDGILFRQEYTDKAEKFYEDHGNKTILLARFIPIVRTFAAVVAGVGHMAYDQFMVYNILGGILWGGGVTLLGYYLGSKVPGLDHYINYVLAAVVVLTFAVSLYHIFKEPEARRQLITRVKTWLKKG